jgi:glycosyltransferase involved in cell wall biosynthesis
MVVSVCMITYNHQDYISKAIEGVLIQKTNFPFELIISNDTSTDKTEDIINEFIATHPNGALIKKFTQVVNLGMMSNFFFAFKKCTGKYIAMCEGDDFWTDPYKLQKQIDFLEANIEYTICYHRVKVLNKKNFIIHDITEERYNKIKNSPITLDDLLDVGNFIHTPSVVFKNVIKEIPYQFEFSSVGDYFLYVMLAKEGFIKRLDDVMAVYRSGVGIHSTQDRITMSKNMLIYQSCILSYLENDDQKKLYLKKQIKFINSFDIYIKSLSGVSIPILIFNLNMFKVKSFLKKLIVFTFSL